MGQAKRRQEALGSIYGTSEGSNAPARLNLHEMTARDLEGVGFAALASDPSYSSAVWLRASAGNEECVIAAWPTIDAAGQFNSHVVALMPKGRNCTILQGQRKTADHREINHFLLNRADVVITER